MIRKYFNTIISVVNIDRAGDTAQTTILQTEKLNDEYILIESCNPSEISELIPFNMAGKTERTQQPAGDAGTINEYRAITLNKDPFNKHSGETLGEICDQVDIKWIKQYLEKSVNEYIKTRLQVLAKHYNLI